VAASRAGDIPVVSSGAGVVAAVAAAEGAAVPV